MLCKVNFLSGVFKRDLNSKSPSHSQVAIPWSQSAVCPTIHA